MRRTNRDVVAKDVTVAGFKLVADGNFLRRAADDHDKAIHGHTDQYALKFVKPKG